MMMMCEKTFIDRADVSAALSCFNHVCMHVNPHQMSATSATNERTKPAMRRRGLESTKAFTEGSNMKRAASPTVARSWIRRMLYTCVQEKVICDGCRSVSPQGPVLLLPTRTAGLTLQHTTHTHSKTRHTLRMNATRMAACAFSM